MVNHIGRFSYVDPTLQLWDDDYLVILSWNLILNYKWTWLNQSLIMSYTEIIQLDQEALKII